MAHSMMWMLAQDNGSRAGIFAGALSCCCGLVWLAFIVLMIAGLYKVFQKAGKPGWAAIVPIYNAIILLEIAGKPIWWIIMFFIPIVNIVFAFLTDDAVAKRFGKSTGFTMGMLLLPFIFFPLLGFSKTAVYNPAATPTVT